MKGLALKRGLLCGDGLKVKGILVSKQIFSAGYGLWVAGERPCA
jgi:hypothetical protein